jgi:hypothetical protein
MHHKRAKTYYFWINTKAYDSEQTDSRREYKVMPKFV